MQKRAKKHNTVSIYVYIVIIKIENVLNVTSKLISSKQGLQTLYLTKND